MPPNTIVKKTVAAVLGTALLISSTAFADTDPVTKVQYFSNSGSAPQLNVTLSNNTVYFAAPGYNPGCGSTPSVDTVKLWLSIAQAALLSGKSVTVNYCSAQGARWISDITLFQ